MLESNVCIEMRLKKLKHWQGVCRRAREGRCGT